MIKNTIKFIGVIAFVAIVAVVGVASADDLGFSANTIVTINSNNYTIQAGSSATSMVIGATTFTVTVPTAGRFTLVSSDRYLLTNDQGVSQTCTTAQNSIVINGPLTVVVTPSATACTTPAPAGGVSYSPPAAPAPAPVVTTPVTPAPVVTTPVTPAPVETTPVTTTPVATVPNLNLPYANTTTVPAEIAANRTALISYIVTLIQSLQTTQTTPTVSGIPAGFQFATALMQGSTGNDVKYLQIFLNSDSATSVGNAGNETTYFGALTRAGVEKFQMKYGIVSSASDAGYGLVGPKTRAKINSMLGQ
jgi:hypothetical protein